MTRVTDLLQRLRGEEFPTLDADLVSQVAEIEELNIFDDDRDSAKKALRQLIEIHVSQEAGVTTDDH